MVRAVRGLGRRSRAARRYRLHPRWESIEAIVTANPDLRLDLGCGFSKPSGFIGLDDGSGWRAQVADENTPDVYLDLTQAPLPFADNSASEVWAAHFLEHIPDDRLGFLFDEVHRVLRPGGTFFVIVPYANSADGMLPGHEVFLTEHFFDRNKVWRELFVTVNAAWDPAPEWDLMPARLRDELGFALARRVMFNVCSQMKVWATPRKGEWADAPAPTCESAANRYLAASEGRSESNSPTPG
jgi:SAM-dependent methyltransferase